MKVITARIEDQYFSDLKYIEREEHADRAEVMRKMLARGIREWKIEKALVLLKGQKITYRKAAALAGVPYTEMIDMAGEADVSIGYSMKELQKDLEEMHGNHR
ncbi:UPF0175 family protein [Candidatus Woesearchaeota archaeon]|nr:UPF0175 family protein [Candidatus Woesearchaeota archaeon]